MAVYGIAKANSANVEFAFDLALHAARDLWKLADEVGDHVSSRQLAALAAIDEWRGVNRDQFDVRLRAETGDGATLADALRSLAGTIASAWAEARGQQDRINKARWVQHQKSDDNILESAWHHFAGDTDYGAPPSDPPVPSPPNFDATRQPIHADFE